MRYQFTKWPADRSIRSGTDLSALDVEISSLGSNEPFQLWMYRDDGESACVLANAEWAYLSILPTDDHYLSSLDKGFSGSKDSVVEIYLENGQLDEMPRINCIPRQQGIAAGLHYFKTGVRAPFVSWIAV